ncbi:hypothetical protein BDQ12DRAFT_499874 [Crucibulum laeve]|uniref:Uncharacterized protein n=1 Tax=Crucibulum laeve TaxID=68775 RepID=A0A5C3LHJ6_9AGAR|nr:hypothetical protein BDQ12DRAFT_499874 [Crucibulum laeve]
MQQPHLPAILPKYKRVVNLSCYSGHIQPQPMRNRAWLSLALGSLYLLALRVSDIGYFLTCTNLK